MTRAPDEIPMELASGQSANGRPADPHAGSGGESGYSVDAFHNGKFFLVQPSDAGHRAGMDAMLLAATVPDGAAGVLADLGAGAGAAGLAFRRAGLHRITPAAVMLVRPRIQPGDQDPAGLFGGGRIGERGFRQRLAAGLADNAFDHVILNPPFNAGADRKTPDPLKAAAHAMESDDLFERWLRTAAAILRPGGQVSIIARPESMAGILAALGNRFGGVEITPVIPRLGEDAIRILVTAIKGSRARMCLRDRILIHQGAGHVFSSEMNDLGNGRAAWPRRTKNRLPK